MILAGEWGYAKDLLNPALNDRVSAADAEGLLADADSRRALSALVLSAVDPAHEIDSYREGDVIFSRDLFGGKVFFDISLKHFVDDFIRR